MDRGPGRGKDDPLVLVQTLASRKQTSEHDVRDGVNLVGVVLRFLCAKIRANSLDWMISQLGMCDHQTLHWMRTADMLEALLALETTPQ